MANTTVKGKFNIVAENGNVQTIYPKTTGDQVLVDRSSNASVIPNDVANLQHIVNKMGSLALKSKVETSDFTTGTMINSIADLKSNSETGKIADATVVKDIESRVDTLENSNLVTVDELDAGLATKPDTEINDSVTSTSLTWSSKKLSDQLTTLNSNTNLLTSRVNGLTTLQEGSTTGDAELIDIRTGYNGIVYNSAGESIRNQISDIYNKYKYHLIDIESMNVFDSIEKSVYYNKRLVGFNTTTYDKIIMPAQDGIGDNCILYDFSINDIPEKYKYMYIYCPEDLNLYNSLILYTPGVTAANYGPRDSINNNFIVFNNRRYMYVKSITFRNYERCIIGFKKDAVLVLFSETDLNLKNTINDYIDINANSDITSIGNSDLYQFVKIFIVNARIGYKYYLTSVWNNHLTAHTRHLTVNSYNISNGEKRKICDYDKLNENDTIPTDIETIVLNSVSGPETVYIEIDWTKGNNSYDYKYPINDKYYQYINDRYEDICTAYDNRVYNTPGDAIRNQITDIYDKYRYHLIDAESMNVFEFIEKDVYYNKRIGGYNTSTFDKIIYDADGDIGKNCILYDFNISDIPEKYKYMYVYIPDDLNLYNYVILYTVGTRASNYDKSNSNKVIIDNRKYLVIKSSTFRKYEKCLLGFKKDAVLVLFSENDLVNPTTDYIDINADSEIKYIDNSNLSQFVKLYVINAQVGYKYYLTSVWNNHLTAHTRHLAVYSYNISNGEKRKICDYDKLNEDHTVPTDIETIFLKSTIGPEHIYIEIDWTKGNNSYDYKYPINDKYYYYTVESDKIYECIMPSKMVCISNNEYNIYYNTLFRFIDTNNLIHPSVSNNKFIPYKKFVKYTPTNETSDFSVYFNFRMNNTQVIDYSSKTMTIKTIPKNSGNGLTKKVLIIGDSLTDAGVSSRELKTLFTNDVMNIEFIGTRDDNTNEGYSGWRAFTFVCCDNQNKEDFSNSAFTQQSVPNPFYNSSIEGLDDGTSRKFDFEYYMINQGYSGVDYVIICLGTNDIARGNHKGDEMKELWDFMINSIKSYNPDVKIGLWLPPTRAMCDNAFKSGIDGSLVANKWIIENYDNREDENIFLIPAQFVVDPENDYNITETPVNSRTPSVTVRTVVDTVHPKQSGYLKIADLMYGYIKYFGYLDSQE